MARTTVDCRVERDAFRDLRPRERQLDHRNLIVFLALDTLVGDLFQHASADPLLDLGRGVADSDLDPGPSARVLELKYAHFQKSRDRVIVLDRVWVAHGRHMPRGRFEVRRRRVRHRVDGSTDGSRESRDSLHFG